MYGLFSECKFLTIEETNKKKKLMIFTHDLYIDVSIMIQTYCPWFLCDDVTLIFNKYTINVIFCWEKTSYLISHLKIPLGCEIALINSFSQKQIKDSKIIFTCMNDCINFDIFQKSSPFNSTKFVFLSPDNRCWFSVNSR